MLEKLAGIHGDILVQALPYFFRQPVGRGRGSGCAAWRDGW